MVLLALGEEPLELHRSAQTAQTASDRADRPTDGRTDGPTDRRTASAGWKSGVALAAPAAATTTTGGSGGGGGALTEFLFPGDLHRRALSRHSSTAPRCSSARCWCVLRCSTTFVCVNVYSDQKLPPNSCRCSRDTVDSCSDTASSTQARVRRSTPATDRLV